MNELASLLDKRWILKSDDKELYYRVRDSIGEIRKFVTEKMGCQLIENSLLVKLEKIPAVPESFMGISEFSSNEEYAYFCVVLMFLEDKDGEEQFILSQLTEYITANMPGEVVDWTLYTNRRRLIKVLRYTVSQGLLRITDGSDDVFLDGSAGEVLYENTGASRYFMRNFSRDIMEYQTPEDFQESEWFDMDEEKGIVRRHRVYKRLLFSVGMYKESGAPEDFDYLKYYGRRLTDDLEQVFDCQVHIHKGSAFFLPGDSCYMGQVFPGNNAVSDIVLLCCGKIREMIVQGTWPSRNDETVWVDQVEFEGLLKTVREEYGAGFTKSFREMPVGEFVDEILKELEKWTFIRLDKEGHQVIVYPSAGKMTGQYPRDYQQK